MTPQPTHSTITRPPPAAVSYTLPTTPRAGTHTTITLPPGSTWTSGAHWHERHTEHLRVLRGAVRVRLDGVERVVRAPVAPRSSPAAADDDGDGDDDGGAMVMIPPVAVHEWMRADRGVGASSEEDDGGAVGREEEVVVRESTEPADGEKALFFWNLNGVVLAASASSTSSAAQPRRSSVVDERLVSWWRACVAELWVPLSLFVIFGAMDNYPVFCTVPRFVGPKVGWRVQWLTSHVVLWMAGIIGWMFGIEAVRRECAPAELFESHAEASKGKRRTD